MEDNLFENLVKKYPFETVPLILTAITELILHFIGVLTLPDWQSILLVTVVLWILFVVALVTGISIKKH